MITPDYAYHADLLTDVDEYLMQKGFKVAEFTYHNLIKEVSRILQSRNTPTALNLRSFSDRVAIHTSLPIEFNLEAKTHQNESYENMAFEALPFCFHYLKSQLGVKCLYAYRNPYIGLEIGFWVHNPPPIKDLFLPPRWEGKCRAWFQEVFHAILGDINIIEANTGGSRDPFVRVDESIVKELPDWRFLVEQLLTNNNLQEETWQMLSLENDIEKEVQILKKKLVWIERQLSYIIKTLPSKKKVTKIIDCQTQMDFK